MTHRLQQLRTPASIFCFVFEFHAREVAPINMLIALGRQKIFATFFSNEEKMTGFVFVHVLQHSKIRFLLFLLLSPPPFVGKVVTDETCRLIKGATGRERESGNFFLKI